MRENFVRLSEDEKTNIRLRKAAGETMNEIADDYGISRERVRSITLSPETRARHNARRLDRYRHTEYGTPEACAKLRARMAARYEKATGRNLLADLTSDSPCPSPRNSLPQTVQKPGISKRSSNGWRSPQANNSHL